MNNGFNISNGKVNVILFYVTTSQNFNYIDLLNRFSQFSNIIKLMNVDNQQLMRKIVDKFGIEINKLPCLMLKIQGENSTGSIVKFYGNEVLEYANTIKYRMINDIKNMNFGQLIGLRGAPPQPQQQYPPQQQQQYSPQPQQQYSPQPQQQYSPQPQQQYSPQPQQQYSPQPQQQYSPQPQYQQRNRYSAPNTQNIQNKMSVTVSRALRKKPDNTKKLQFKMAAINKNNNNGGATAQEAEQFVNANNADTYNLQNVRQNVKSRPVSAVRETGPDQSAIDNYRKVVTGSYGRNSMKNFAMKRSATAVQGQKYSDGDFAAYGRQVSNRYQQQGVSYDINNVKITSQYKN